MWWGPVGSSQHCWRQQAVSSAVEQRGAERSTVPYSHDNHHHHSHTPGGSLTLPQPGIQRQMGLQIFLGRRIGWQQDWSICKYLKSLFDLKCSKSSIIEWVKDTSVLVLWVVSEWDNWLGSCFRTTSGPPSLSLGQNLSRSPSGDSFSNKFTFFHSLSLSLSLPLSLWIQSPFIISLTARQTVQSDEKSLHSEIVS